MDGKTIGLEFSISSILVSAKMETYSLQAHCFAVFDIVLFSHTNTFCEKLFHHPLGSSKMSSLSLFQTESPLVSEL